jgi:hypothetical protein
MTRYYPKNRRLTRQNRIKNARAGIVSREIAANLFSPQMDPVRASRNQRLEIESEKWKRGGDRFVTTKMLRIILRGFFKVCYLVFFKEVRYVTLLCVTMCYKGLALEAFSAG